MTEQKVQPEAEKEINPAENEATVADIEAEDNTTDVVDDLPEQTLDSEQDALPQAEQDDGEDQEQSEVEKLLQQVDEFKAALQRERADFINFKKRVEREKTEMRGNVTSNTLLKFLPVIDDFDRAMATLPDDVQENDWAKGFSMIHKKFHDMLNNMGVVPLNPLGEPFDPNFHEAIGSDESDEYDSDHVIEVLQKGYMMDDKCIRPAIVRVAI